MLSSLEGNWAELPLLAVCVEYLVDENSLILRGIGGSLGRLAPLHGRLYLGGHDSLLVGGWGKKLGGAARVYRKGCSNYGNFSDVEQTSHNSPIATHIQR